MRRSSGCAPVATGVVAEGLVFLDQRPSPRFEATSGLRNPRRKGHIAGGRGRLLKESDPNHATVYDCKIETIGKVIADVGPMKRKAKHPDVGDPIPNGS